MEGSAKRQVPRLLIAGTGRGIGLSSLVLGLLVCFRKAGMAVSTAVLGSSLVQTTHCRRVSGRLSHTVDPWFLSREAIKDSLARISAGAELVLIDSDRGLFDSFDPGASYLSAADVAADLEIPVVLVVDARGYRESIEALLRGFTQFRESVQIVGVIAAQVDNEEHADLIRDMVSRFPKLTFLGSVPYTEELKTGLADVGSEYNPSLLTRSKLVMLGERIKNGIDIEGLVKLAGKTVSALPEPFIRVKQSEKCRIAVADDAAFHLTVQDNLDLIRRLGADIVPFSPLADLRLPANISAVYLPGGYAHLYATDLSNNRAMLAALNEFAQRGGMLYAEAEAIALCAKKLVLANGQTFEMSGILPATVTSTIPEDQFPDSQPCEVIVQRANILAEVHQIMRGHALARWLVRPDETFLNCFQTKDLRTRTQSIDGFCPQPHILISLAQLHWGQLLTNQESSVRAQLLARHFVESAAVATGVRS